MSINRLDEVRRCPCWALCGQRKLLHCFWWEGKNVHMEARLKLDTSFLPSLCQLKPGSFMITSSSPSLYILCSYIKAHVLKLCSLDSVFLIHAGMPVSVRYSISAAHHTTRPHLEGFVQVVLRDQSAFSGFVYLFIYFAGPVASAPCSVWVITDWAPTARLGTGSLVLPDSVLPAGRGQAGCHSCLKSLENPVLWEPRRVASSWCWSRLEMSLPDLFWH